MAGPWKRIGRTGTTAAAGGVEEVQLLGAVGAFVVGCGEGWWVHSFGPWHAVCVSAGADCSSC